MSKKVLIFVIAIIITIIFFTIIMFSRKNQKNKDIQNQNLVNETIIDDIQTVSELSLNISQYINSKEKIKIKDTDDYLIITDDVKWEVPEYEEGTTISYSLTIPYTIVVDGEEYNGEFILGDFENHKDDRNPKYNILISDLTANGKIKLLVEEK